MVKFVADAIYNGATHWSAILKEIELLRTDIGQQDRIEEADQVDDIRGTEDKAIGLLFGAGKPLSLQQVISKFLPPRHEADRLVAAYFRAKAVSAPFVHAAHFRRLYISFWDDPFIVSPLWTSILFSILHVATETLFPASVSVRHRNVGSVKFSTASAHCLAIGEYFRPQRFAVEALLLYAQSICLTSVDISPDLGVLFGTLVRVATIMGYHRDPDSTRNDISAFDGEMRRRTWSLCMQLDMLVSFPTRIAK